MPDKMLLLLKEPLVHFVLAGLALFALFAWRGEDADPESRTITITEEQVGQLAANWVQTWRRPPTEAEMDGLIRDYIKEEIYYREGLRLGLDSDDMVIRRRIRSKMEFLAVSEAENAKPTDAQLQALLDRNPNAYATDTRYTFDQIFIDGSDLAAAQKNAARILASLAKGTNWQDLGDSISLPRSVEKADKTRVSSDFGEEFTGGLGELKIGTWSGPIKSGFGLHIVRVRAVEASRTPTLAEARQELENDWRSQSAKDREAKAYQTLLDSYTIEIARP